MMKKRSLVLITVDCLRADHVGFQGYSRAVTPFLDSLAKNSAVFSNAIVAGAPTYFSFPAIMASRYPLALGREVLGVAPGESTISSALQESGYATAAFLAANPYLSPRFGYHQGFGEFRDFLDSALPAESPAAASVNGWWSTWNRRLEAIARRTHLTATVYEELYFWYCQGYSARESASFDQLRRYPAANVIIDQACSWMKSVGNDNFFLWLHLMDPHHPYFPPKEALAALGMSHISARRARFLNSFWNRGDVGPERLQRYRDEILSLYDAGVLWVDRQISRLVATLQELQRWDDTVFAVTADHGEEFLEQGTRYHSPNALPEQLIRVPLLLRAPELSEGRVLQSPFSLIHLAPTLLEAVGAVVPEAFQGQSRWPKVVQGELPDEPAIAECLEACNNPLHVDDRIRSRLLVVRDREHKLVLRFSKKSDSLYDLKKDPGEREVLSISVQPQKRARLLQIAQAHLAAARKNRNLDLAVRARLREIRHSMKLPLKKNSNNMAVHSS